MYARDGVLKGDVNMTLRVEEGGHYRDDFRSLTSKFISGK